MLEQLFALDLSMISIILDVILVAFLIYRLILLVHGTRAEPMLFGLLVLGLIYVASVWFNLVVLEWLLGQFLASIILIVVVVFQDQLRRGLTRIGLFSGLGHTDSQSLDLAIKEVCKAAMTLSKRRIGALMVLKREVGMEEYCEHAVKIDALVSDQLLVSLFLPAAPIHDGAVIIEADRIKVAGAVLPLSFNPAIGNELGTRHRAAIGLSERTDAVVIVVSEESGNVSMVRDGRISQDLSENALYNALHRLTVQNKQEKKQDKKTERVGKEDVAEGSSASETKSTTFRK